MKLEVGMYVRTLKGIARIVGIVLEPDNYYFQCWIADRYLCICDDTEYLCDSDILKANHNIIDLIEVGDYVNGEKVTSIIPPDILADEELDHVHISSLNGEEIFEDIEIKSVVTKEQFESMKYEL